MLFLERELTALGLRPTRFDVEERRFNLLCTVGSGSPRVCLNAHADTVPPNGQSTPSARIEGDLLYGLGSCDDKAAIAAMVTAFLELASRADDLGGTADLLISVDEDGDGRGVRTALEQGYRCDLAIVGEPTSLNVVHAHCGMLFLNLTTSGVAAHGSNPSDGVNAIERMMALVDELRGAVTRFDPYPGIGEPSMNLGVIQGGDRPNRVPSQCAAQVDIRVVPTTRLADVYQAVEDVFAGKEWAHWNVDKEGESMETPVGSLLVQTVLSSAGSLGIESRPWYLRGWTEAEPFRTHLGIDAVVVGPGHILQAHSSNEYTSISQTQRAAALYADVVTRLCRGDD